MDNPRPRGRPDGDCPDMSAAVEGRKGGQETSAGQAGMSKCDHVAEWPCFGHFGQFGRFGQLGMTANCPRASSGCVLDRGGG